MPHHRKRRTRTKLPSAPDDLLCDPGVETLFQLIAMISPELWVHIEGRLEVIRRCRKVWQGCRSDTRNGIFVGRAIGNVFRLLRLRANTRSKRNETIGFFNLWRSLGDCPPIPIQALVIPDDLEGLLVSINRILQGGRSRPKPSRPVHRQAFAAPGRQHASRRARS